MATINKQMKTFNVPSGNDTKCYEIVDDKGRKCLAKDWATNSSSAFAVGEYVIKDGVCYKFTSAHTAGSAWSASEVTATNLGNELRDLKSALNSVALEEMEAVETQSNSYASISSGNARIYTGFSGCSVKTYDVGEINGNILSMDITRLSGSTAVFYVFAKANGNAIEYYQDSNTTELADYCVEVPQNAKLLYVNYDNTANNIVISKYTRIKQLENEIEDISANIEKMPYMWDITKGIMVADKLPRNQGFFDDSKFTVVNSNYIHLVIPVDSGDVVKFKTISNTYYGVLKSYVKPTEVNDPIYYSSAEDYTQRKSLTGDTEGSVTVPNDSRYIILITKYNGAEVGIQYITINGTDISIDYITERVSDLEASDNKNSNIVKSISNLIDYDILQENQGFFSDSTFTSVNSNYAHKVIPVTPGDKLNFKYRATVYYGVLTNYVRPTKNGDPIYYSSATGYTGRLSANGEEDVEITIPSDSNYVIICTFYNGAENILQEIKLNGYNIAESAAVQIRDMPQKIKNDLYNKGYYSITDDMADGDEWIIPHTNAKKNNIHTFMGKITTFSKVLVGNGKNKVYGTWLEVDSTQAIVKCCYAGGTIDSYSFTHGLTIATYLYIQINVKNAKADIKIFTNGQSYNIENVLWHGCSTDNFVESDGSAFSDAKYTWCCADFRKSLWLYGDSYLSLVNSDGEEDIARWPYWLDQNGQLNNVYIGAYGGESSTYGKIAFQNALQYYGKPQFLLWAHGMNDGSDSESAPQSTWKNAIDDIIKLCNDNGITLILATIPTVPAINNEQKNAYVRSLASQGYRYVDFASAVGANASGVWYAGMLNSDNVHPTALGALALYMQAITDLPELTYSNP